MYRIHAFLAGIHLSILPVIWDVCKETQVSLTESMATSFFMYLLCIWVAGTQYVLAREYIIPSPVTVMQVFGCNSNVGRPTSELWSRDRC